MAEWLEKVGIVIWRPQFNSRPNCYNFVLGSPEFNSSAMLVKYVVKGIFVNCELLVLFPVNCEISF